MAIGPKNFTQNKQGPNTCARTHTTHTYQPHTQYSPHQFAASVPSWTRTPHATQHASTYTQGPPPHMDLR